MLRGKTNGSVSVLLYLISFYFDCLKHFCESKPGRNVIKENVIKDQAGFFRGKP